MPPPTAIRTGLRQIARLTTWKASSATNSVEEAVQPGTSRLASKTSAAAIGWPSAV